MKVARQTHTQLIVEDRPWLIMILLCATFLGAFIAAIGAFASNAFALSFIFAIIAASSGYILIFAVRRIQIIFDRPKATITLRTRNMRTYREVVHALGDLSHAELEGTETTRCVLVFDKGMSAGRHPVTTYLVSGPRPMRITDAINAWLEQSSAVDSETLGD